MPPTARTEERLRQKKQAKQKKVLFLLLPLLVILGAVQGPGLVKRLSKAQEATEDVQSQVVEGFEELAPSGPPTTTAGEPATGTDAGAALVAADGLADTDAPPEGDEETLISFTRFEAHDPFVQLVDDVEEGTSESSATGTSGSTGTTTVDTGSSTTPSTTTVGSTGGDTGVADDSGTTATTTQVTINVNGEVVVVNVGETFPPGDPAFELRAIDGDIVKIGLASGSFSNGVDTIDLEVGDSVTLISQPDGARFQIKIVKLG